jgi:hypothetical protein
MGRCPISAYRGGVAIDVYQAILEHAPNGTYTSAGDLHEAIWTDLLRRSDPKVHNVRVTRGDGGLDGVGFQDPVTGEARVYQAKFFQDLSDDKDAHKKAVVEAFVRAHCHPFTCTSWVLLFPRQLSHTELGWLMSNLKTDAIAFATTFKGAHAQVQQRVQACAIEYLDASDLVDLLTSHLDIAAKHLPKSHLALSAELQKEREGRAHDRAELARNLQVLSDEAIRSHQADARRAKAALSILNQGWANLTGTLQLALVDSRLTGAQIHDVAGLIEEHATSRAVHAYSCEGLVPGISELVAEINYQARLLKQVSVIKDIGMADAEGEAVVAKRVLNKIQELQWRIGDVVKRSFLG